MLSTKSTATPMLFKAEGTPSRDSGITNRRRGFRFHWEDALWVAIVGALTSLWVVLLMSPAWH